ncbi:hypothetical protein QYE76_032153 [Lolium multiflorum]|uniref:Transposase (putative) gypsy type domain-containing protein n=1 Tax=Lolium multiflorum TaxID=4521 RepID=A0AAD8VKW3_LOLMU|nr:hypothetical protein QYE76_032153 [Lolium multiflorum]
MEPTEISGWERSKISNQDLKTLKTLGLLKKEESLIFPGEESFPTPRIGYRVTFVDHLIRGLSTPIHEFLRGLLFVYGIQLHQLTPNSILHISIFITLCECFLRTHPHWGLWKRIFYLWRNSSRNVAYNVGGVVICVRPEVDYFDVKFLDSVQGWRRRWLYIQEKDVDSQEYNIAPFDRAAKILQRRSWDAEATDEDRTATDALMKRIHELQNTRGKEMQGIGRSNHDTGGFAGNFISNFVDTIIADPGKSDSIRLLRVHSAQRFLPLELFRSTRKHGDDLRQRPLQRQRRRNPSTAGIAHFRIDEFKRVIVTRPIGWSDRIDVLTRALDSPLGVLHVGRI